MRVVFALLVVAAVGAFFLTTRLKRSDPVVERVTHPRYLSPNGDGRKDALRIGFRTRREDEVTVSIVTSDGDEAAVVVRDRLLPAGRHHVRWDGRTATGRVADGEYRVRIGLRRQGRSATSGRKLIVDTAPPAPVVRYVSPAALSPDGAGAGNRARLRFDGPLRNRPELLVYRTDTEPPRLVARRPGRARSPVLTWDGRVGLGRRSRSAPPGTYLLRVRVRDAAGNIGSGGPPARGEVAGHPGIYVRYVAATGPLHAVQAGALAQFAVESDGRRYRWSLRRVGGRRPVARGSSGARRLVVRTPRGRSGLMVLRLDVGRRSYFMPFGLRARERRRARVLVVLPVASWQARRRTDLNGDGFPDRLPEDRRLALARPLGGNGLPSGFASGAAPVLQALEEANVRFDVATDVQLAERRAGVGEGVFDGYRGVLVAGAPRFHLEGLVRELRRYVARGGRVGWAGTDGFRRPLLRAGAQLLARGQAPRRRNAFGERVTRSSSDRLLAVLRDTIDFFEGVTGPLGPFRSVEEGLRLPTGARLLASAGTGADRPAISVYRLGRGAVARVGADMFAPSDARSPEGGRIMRSLWTLLSR